MAVGGGPNIPRRQRQLLDLRARGWSLDQMCAMTGLRRRTIIVTLSKAKRAELEAAIEAGKAAGRERKDPRPRVPVAAAGAAAGYAAAYA